MGGGCANLVETALMSGDRDSALHLLDLEGCCGVRGKSSWIRKRSTLPWNEGLAFLALGDTHLVDLPRRRVSIRGRLWRYWSGRTTRAPPSRVFFYTLQHRLSNGGCGGSESIVVTEL